MDKYKVRKCIEKLAYKESDDEKMKLLYEWTKTGYIGFKEFKHIVYELFHYHDELV